MRRLLISVIVLLAMLFFADRVAAGFAERKLAQQVQRTEQLGSPPAVQVKGFPFLDQAFRGRYEDVEVRLQDVRSDRVRAQTVVVEVRDARVPLTALLSGRLSAVPVGELRGVAHITYADAALATGVAGLRIRAKGDQLQLSFPVTRFGRTTQVVATARIGVAGGGLRISEAALVGSSVPPELARGALSRVEVQVPLGRLPFGLRLTEVRVTDSGLDLSAGARNTVLRGT